MQLCALRDAWYQDDVPEIVGRSLPRQRLVSQIRKAASSHAPVLVEGETGTGKELVGRALHRLSPRSGGSCELRNIGSTVESLLASQLFGHRKGAFTGATEERKGVFTLADRGTVILDEIGEASPEIQVCLLRAVEYGEIEPVGADRVVKVDVRIVAMTHQDLHALVANRRFRRDLLARLDAIRIRVPPLRDRRKDIPLLIDHFLKSLQLEAEFDAAARAELEKAPWPENVRGLRNCVVRLSTMRGPRIGLQDVREDLAERDSGSTPSAPPPTEAEAERDRVAWAWRASDWSAARAAKLIGITEFGFRKKAKRLGFCLTKPVQESP